MAKPAELNGYPGPPHVPALASGSCPADLDQRAPRGIAESGMEPCKRFSFTSRSGTGTSVISTATPSSRGLRHTRGSSSGHFPPRQAIGLIERLLPASAPRAVPTVVNSAWMSALRDGCPHSETADVVRIAEQQTRRQDRGDRTPPISQGGAVRPIS
jgi:hypothetical protein